MMDIVEKQALHRRPNKSTIMKNNAPGQGSHDSVADSRIEEALDSSCPASSSENNPSTYGWIPGGHSLNEDMIGRYSRQLLVPSFGVQGQQDLLKSSILVVGAGGLGSPVALYLAASGIGCLGIIDYDTVELNNLHRQVIHTEAMIGKSKVVSAAATCLAINSSLKVVEYQEAINASNAVEFIRKYDVVVDATDNVPTRYLINDACVALGKPLVSGAALGMEGQLTVYNHKQGPCYRCLFPVPPPQGACQRCSDNGVLGVVPGIIGCFQALEAIKIASGVGEPLSRRMLIFDAFSTRINTVKLRERNLECIACGDNPQIRAENIHQFNYESFTDSPLSDESPTGLILIPASQRISSKMYGQCLQEGRPHLLLDVRERHQYSISALPNSMNIPLSALKEQLQIVEEAGQNLPIIVVCRRGNDSQRAVQYLQGVGLTDTVDIIGGLESWTKDVDPNFPLY